MTEQGLNRYRGRESHRHTHLFTMTRLHSSTVIRYDGEVLVRIRRGNPKAGADRPSQRSDSIVNKLPPGLNDLLAQMIMELLCGIRTDLWDSYAINGAKLVPARQAVSALCDDPACPHAGVPHFRTVPGPREPPGA